MIFIMFLKMNDDLWSAATVAAAIEALRNQEGQVEGDDD